ncbi:MAG: Type 1 glutamine amidotransferase-like domain-containing protein, partial [Planctomycetes bacterium]|nr:Type 1 glutamine amidotransferase-like domain-containing protein [Planctomycetota bacterium]
IVGLTGKRKPRALFIPTASGDAERYVETFEAVYGKRLGCRVETLRLLTAPPSRREMNRMIAAADLVYVGGGNTLRMMRRWRVTGADRALIAAAKRGTVMSGLSAGAICWFAYGNSDSRAFSGKESWSHIRVRGLGLVPLLYCPHYDSEKRHKPLRAMVAAHGGPAVACDDCTALEISGDSYRILSARKGQQARLLCKEDGTVRVNPLATGSCRGAFRPLGDLLDGR